MHGRLKVRTTAEEAERKRNEQQIKVKTYRTAMKRIFEKRKLNEFDEELLMITGQVLSRNPDVYTLWNIRKECILRMGDKLENEFKHILFSKDLDFTAQCLMVNPKSYGAWHHRCWILENSQTPDWNNELSLCNKYLKLDERNFHCWDYRRFVVRKSGVSSEDELSYCSEKIRNNFSNYSSWHYRSKLLPILHPHERNSSRPISEEKLKEELEMVLTAAFTDPNDSSAWFYQRWLLGYSQPPLNIAAVRISKNLVTVGFSNSIDLKEFEVKTNFGIEFKTNEWQPIRKGHLHDNIWKIESTFEVNASEQANYTLNCKSSKGDYYTIELRRCNGGFVGINYPKFEYEFGTAVIEVLRNQLDSCNQLLEYEPDSKWTLLTAALLMRAIDRKEYHIASLEYLRKLESIDYLRKGYYADLASKWAIEKRLEQWIDVNDLTVPLDLSKLNLTTVYYEQYISIADTLNLSYNCLVDRATAKLNAFQFCKKLNLAYNNLSSTGAVPHLPNLMVVSLEGNKFSDDCEIHCWDYRRFVVRKSGVSSEDELSYCSEKIRNNFSNYSSWHYRSKLLPILHPHERNSSRPISEEKLKEELEMVLTAAFTDPNDSSAWFYQRWLLGYSQPPLNIAAVRISKNLVTVGFSNSIDLKEFEVKTNFGIEFKTNEWQPIRKGHLHDNIWKIESTFEVNASEQANYTLNCKSSKGDYYTIELRRCNGGFVGINYPKFEYEFGTAVIEVLRNQLDSCNQLLEYEPDSKWTLLTAALLMRAIDRKEYHIASLEYLRKLESIDYLRKGYYADLASKWAIEKRLEQWIDVNDLTVPLDLSKLNLMTVYYEQYISIADTLNLSYNCLVDRATAKLNAFQFCKKLNLAYNNLSSTGAVPHLPNLMVVSLEGNKFSDDCESLNN